MDIWEEEEEEQEEVGVRDISHTMAATTAAEKAPEAGNWIADDWEQFLLYPVGP